MLPLRVMHVFTAVIPLRWFMLFVWVFLTKFFLHLAFRCQNDWVTSNSSVWHFCFRKNSFRQICRCRNLRYVAAGFCLPCDFSLPSGFSFCFLGCVFHNFRDIELIHVNAAGNCNEKLGVVASRNCIRFGLLHLPPSDQSLDLCQSL